MIFTQNNSNKSMRLFSFIPALFILFILAGSVTAAAQQVIVEGSAETQKNESNGSCNVEKLVQNNLVMDDNHQSALDPERISVLNWNIYKEQRENWMTDFKRYSYKHDVVMIQEAHLGEDLKSVLDKQHQYWTLNTAFHYQDKATGVMTASRVKPVHSCGQSTAEPFIRFPKTSLVSYYPVKGMNENLLVANIHGINFTLGVGVYREQIEKLYAVMKYHKGPVVLAGDFNTWSDARMQIVDDLARRLSLDSLDYTSHNRTVVFGNPIDHVFYRGLEPLEHDTWHVTSSDHNPTRVSFRVKDDDVVDVHMAMGELADEDC
jgi:endonuclease/exonuclease/phosphatase (EEP) superfamily protein YafD